MLAALASTEANNEGKDEEMRSLYEYLSLRPIARIDMHSGFIPQCAKNG